MKNTKRFLFAIAIAMLCGAFSASAQIYVDVRPTRPVIVRTVAPSPRHVWIDEDWEWRDGRYVWVGGRWEEPREGFVYRPGHWSHGDRGHHWEPGRWVARGERRHDRR